MIRRPYTVEADGTMTQAQVAAELGLSRARVGQIEAAALEKLRRHLELEERVERKAVRK
jgi:DNA-directed RNA polymerase sigma subunit (sigma70/sigma32)